MGLTGATGISPEPAVVLPAGIVTPGGIVLIVAAVEPDITNAVVIAAEVLTASFVTEVVDCDAGMVDKCFEVVMMGLVVAEVVLVVVLMVVTVVLRVEDEVTRLLGGDGSSDSRS